MNDLPIQDRHCKIDGYPCYYITDKGDVYTYRTSNVGWQGLRKLQKRGMNNPNRYLQVCLCDNGYKKYVQVHRLVAQYFCPGYFEGAVVNHKNTDIHDNDYRNLEWVTQQENIVKSYKSSGIDQTRNYKFYTLYLPDGTFISGFKGRNKAIKFIKDRGYDVSISYLVKFGKSRGYKLFPENTHKESSNDYPQGVETGEIPGLEAPSPCYSG